MASLLLLGVDPAVYPVFRSSVFTRTLELLDLEEALPGTPNELAAMLGVTELSVRDFLRDRFSRPSDEKGTRWELDDEQARAVIEHFGADASAVGELGGRYGGFVAVLLVNLGGEVDGAAFGCPHGTPSVACGGVIPRRGVIRL